MVVISNMTLIKVKVKYYKQFLCQGECVLYWVMLRGVHKEPMTWLSGRLTFCLSLGDNKEDSALFLLGSIQFIKETCLIQT